MFKTGFFIIPVLSVVSCLPAYSITMNLQDTSDGINQNYLDNKPDILIEADRQVSIEVEKIEYASFGRFETRQVYEYCSKFIQDGFTTSSTKKKTGNFHGQVRYSCFIDVRVQGERKINDGSNLGEEWVRYKYSNMYAHENSYSFTKPNKSYNIAKITNESYKRIVDNALDAKSFFRLKQDTLDKVTYVSFNNGDDIKVDDSPSINDVICTGVSAYCVKKAKNIYHVFGCMFGDALCKRHADTIRKKDKREAVRRDRERRNGEARRRHREARQNDKTAWDSGSCRKCLKINAFNFETN